MARTGDEDRELAINVVAHVLEAMERDGLSQNEIERRAGFKAGRLSRYITGNRVSVPLNFIVRLAKAIGSNPSRLLGGPPEDRRFLDAARRRQVGDGHVPRIASPRRARAARQR